MLNKFDVMEHLWDTLEKTPDGKHLLYGPGDIDQLWLMGFVDTQKFGLDVWREYFEPMRQPDGMYLLTKDQFLAIDRFRYKGEIKIPFDAMLINEGKYTNEGLDELIDASIAPSCMLPRPDLNKFFNDLKDEFRQPDGLILVKKPAKLKIKKLLDEYPSPLRSLELLLDIMIKSKGDEAVANVERSDMDAASMQAAIQASKFSARPASRTESQAMALKNLQRTSKAPAPVGEADKGKPSTELKKIRRSHRGMRG